MVRGEHDGIATEDDLLEFFRRLPNPDRQFIVLAGASHAVALGLSRGQLWHVVRAFLPLPTAGRGHRHVLHRYRRDGRPVAVVAARILGWLRGGGGGRREPGG